MGNIKFTGFTPVTDFTELVGIESNKNARITKAALKTALGIDPMAETLSHFIYNPVTDKLEADRAIETTLNSLFLGEQHKMSSGAENIFFTNLSTNTNYYSMKGGLKDQSLTANQGASGFIPPTGRVYTDMFSIPLGGTADPLTSIGYSGGNYFGVNIAGLGITTVAAEQVEVGISLEYTLQVNGKKVYKQILNRDAALTRADKTIYPNDTIEWFFDHPVEILAGTTIFAEIRKIDRTTDEDFGVFQVRQGDAIQADGNYRYQAIVHNRLFEDKDLELISPYSKYKAMDFGLDSTGSTILLRDLRLGDDSLLVPYAVNTLEAIISGTEIKIKVKGGAKVVVESLPVSAVSINGSFVNSVLNQAVVQLNGIFTNTAGFASDDTFVSSFTLIGNDLTLGLNDGTSYTTNVTSLGVDENNFVESGALNGTNLVLTMGDATTVTIDASSLAVDTNTTITFGTLANNLLTLNASDSSTVTIDVSSLNVDTNLYVESGVLDGTQIVLTMSDGTTVSVDALGLAVDNNTTIYSGIVSGTDIILSLSDASIITIDASTLQGSTGTSNEVVSGSVIGNNLVLVMADATEITIDAANMINGSSLAAVNENWYYSYGALANQEVAVPYNNNGDAPSNAPFYFGTQMTRGSEMRWNMRNLSNFDIGIWDGAEVATSYGFGIDDANWSTAFNFNGGFQDGTNTDLKATQFSGNKYGVNHDTPVTIRFGNDGHLTLIDLLGGNEVVIAKTQSPLAVQSFSMQLALWQNNEFPNAYVTNSENLWEIAHDFDSSEAGVFNGIEDHTVIQSTITISQGEKFMFDLDRNGSGEFFGTNYAGASTANPLAEQQLSNSFEYKTNEAVTLGGDWTANTAAANYFVTSGLDSWRVGGSNNKQGIFSIRYNFSDTIELWSETENELIATSLFAGNGASLGFYMGSDEAMTYVEIPTVTKQSITQGAQPNANFVPTVANQSTTVQEADVLNYSIVSSDNIVNQFVTVDAPSWLFLNQNTGVLSGTAPAFAGTAADTIVVNCKAGNAVGGTVDFTVTINVSEIAGSYTNSKSLALNGSSTFLQGNAVSMTAMDRATNGDGNGWTVSMWIKPSSSTSTQTLLNYGQANDTAGGAITIYQHGGSNIFINYGTTSNRLIIVAVGCLNVGVWNQVTITFDGGTTGSAQSDLAQYYSRFSICVDGVVASQSGSHVNYGYTGAINGNNTSDNIFRIGRANNVYNNYFEGTINQVGIWSSNQYANKSAIYNGGATQDLSLLSSPPAHYYEIESSVTSIVDISGGNNLVGYNFSASDLVTDAP